MTEVAWIVMGIWSATKVLGLIIDAVQQMAWEKMAETNRRNYELHAKIEELEQQIEELKK